MKVSLPGSTPQSCATFATMGRGLRALAFQYQRRGRGAIRVAEFLKQRLPARQCACRTRAEREKLLRAFAVRQPPAGILAREAGDEPDWTTG